MNLSIKEAALSAGVTEKTIRVWIKEERFTVTRYLNRRIEINVESFNQFIKALKEKRIVK